MKVLLSFLISLLCCTAVFADEDDAISLADTITSDSILCYQTDDSIQAPCAIRNNGFIVHPAFPDDSLNTYTNPYYNWKRDMTYAGVPLFISSFIIKGRKTGFRSARFSFSRKFKSEIDNYTQYSPYALILGCKLAGYHGRSDWGRFLVSTGLANVAMAITINSLKYSIKEMRPDNSSSNSFPSGHTATVFTAATILHKEYGLTRSPLFSIGGYAVATATGVMRVLNNRHWISDVMAGAGIGILSAELGYFAADLIFRNKGIKHYEFDNLSDPDHPSFFDIQMGMSLHDKTLEFTFDDPSISNDYIKLGTSTTFGVESAYFFNKHFGIGALARVTSTPAQGLNFSDQQKEQIGTLNELLSQYQGTDGTPLPGIHNVYIENSNFNKASLDGGVYFNLSLGKHFSFGAKALAGVRFGDGICYKAKNGVPRVDKEYFLFDKNGQSHPIYWYETSDGSQFRSTELLEPGVSQDYNFVLDNPTEEFECMRIRENTSFNYVLGTSITWRYKTNFAWKAFVDFDSAHTTYTYRGKYFSDEAIANIGSTTFPASYPKAWNAISKAFEGHSSRTFNLFTLGGSFCVNF